MTGCRIGRVRMKNGGADVRVLRTPMPNDDGKGNWRGKLIAHAKGIAENGADDLVGYVVVGVHKDGSYSTGFRVSHADCPIPPTLFPTWVAELLRREMIVAPEAADEFDRRFEWRDG